MSRVINFFWGVSFLVFLAVFLFVYAYSPEQIAVIADFEGGGDVFISRENFFYTGIIGFTLWNALVLILAKVLQMLPVGPGNFFSTLDFRQTLVSWVYSFGMVVNAYFILMTLFISFYNGSEAKEMSGAGLMLYIGPALIGIWLIALLVILIRRK